MQNKACSVGCDHSIITALVVNIVIVVHSKSSRSTGGTVKLRFSTEARRKWHLDTVTIGMHILHVIVRQSTGAASSCRAHTAQSLSSSNVRCKRFVFVIAAPLNIAASMIFFESVCGTFTHVQSLSQSARPLLPQPRAPCRRPLCADEGSWWSHRLAAEGAARHRACWRDMRSRRVQGAPSALACSTCVGQGSAGCLSKKAAKTRT
jgi:hypothetical protein